MKKKQPVSQLSVDGVCISDHASIAEHFNKYFHSVFSSSNLCTPNVSVFAASDVSFISYAGIVSMLLNLKTKTCCGPDDIPNTFLRRYAESLGKFLVVLFRASLMYGMLPEDWRAARVVPVFKKGDRSLPQNYRPISLTSSCCKLIEHIIANHILDYLKEHAVLTPWQHGFRKGYSTVTQLVTITHSFASVLDNNGQIDSIFLDFSKAFDKVPHDKLIFKLRTVGLSEMIISWITSYLSNRIQRVTIGEQSGCLPVTSGVPQGSVLGPLLFLLYINDIVSVVVPGVCIRLFADDCALFKSISCANDQDGLQTSLNNIKGTLK